MPVSEEPFTFTALVDEVLGAVHGYVRDQQQVTTLLAPITTSDVSFQVAEPAEISRGIIEIDEELMAVKTVDSSSGVVTLQPWGRGQSQSDAAAHSANAKIINSPLYPRQDVRQEIFATLREIFPDVFPTAMAFLDVDVTRTNYPLPADVYQVLAVQWLLPGPSRMWAPMRRWRQNHIPGAQEIELIGPLWPGQARARYQYMRTPPEVYGLVDDLTTYGYSPQIKDIIVIGATSRLLAKTEAARLQVESVESHGRSQDVPTGANTASARYLYQVLQKRLADERAQNLMRYPLQIHYTR